MINNNNGKWYNKSPYSLFVILVLSIFFSETISMIFVYLLRPFPSDLVEVIFDATSQLILLSPVLYFFLLRPLLLNIEESKVAEEKLQKIRNEEYQTILQTAMDGFVIMDTKGRIVDVNDTYCRFIGYSRIELLNMEMKNLEARETSEEIAQHIRNVVEKGYDRFETMHRCKNGGLIDIEVSTSFIDDGSERLFLFLRDITERKRLDLKVTENTIALKKDAHCSDY